MKKILLLIPFILFSCAKDRPIDEIVTSGEDEVRLAKSTFNTEKLWYSKATIISRSENTPLKRLFVGSASDLKLGYFVFKRDTLNFYDAVSIYDENDKEVSDDLLYSWNIRHSEYHLKESNGEVTNIEEENNHIDWSEKNFFKVDFAQALISPKKDIGATESRCWTTKSASVIEGSREVSANHIAYTIEYVYEYNHFYSFACKPVSNIFDGIPTYTIQIRYSFKPRDEIRSPDYTSYVYDGENDPLMRKYGYFKVKVKTLDDLGMDQTIWLMKRWNPKKTHTYYFAKGTPEELKIFYTHPENGIFKKINDTLSLSGEAIQFEIKDYDGSVCQFGDVGCSFIKIITTDHNGAPLGYGPSYADPLTGETISGNTMIWTAGAKKRIGHYLKVYTETSLAAPENSSVYALMKETLGEKTLSKWTASAEALKGGTTQKIYNTLLPEYTYTRKNYHYTTFAELKTQNSEYLKEITSIEEDFASLPIPTDFEGEMIENLENDYAYHQELYENDMDDYIYKQLDNRHVDSADNILGTIKNMLISGRTVDEIFSGLFFHTAIHELGHTLNLEHNFYGSVDLANFEEKKVAKDIEGNVLYKKDSDGNVTEEPLMVKPSSTSVMEYMIDSDTLDENLDFGPYDKAALQYAYSSGTKDTDTTFLFCTHDSVDEMSLCNMHDSGVTPSEIAMSMIESYENWFPIRNYRAGRSTWSTLGYGRARYFFMKKLKTFMKMQKSTFDLKEMKQKLSLSDFTEEEIETAYNEIQADMKQAVNLTLSFYDAVIHQKDYQRSFKDIWSDGQLQKKGIWYDKLYAMSMLYQNHYMSYQPDQSVLTSYLDYLQDDQIGPIYSEVLKKGLVERVDEYADVDLYRISQFIGSTVQSATTAGSGEIPNVDLMGIKCFTESSFAQFYPEELSYEDAQVVSIPIANLPSYYHRAIPEGSETLEIAFYKEGNKVYASSEIHNTFAFAMMSGQIELLSHYSDPLIALRSGIRKMKSVSKMYKNAIGEDIYSCD